MLAQEADGPAVRIVVIAEAGDLDPHVLQAEAVQQMTGEFATGALKVRAVVAVTR